MIAILYPLKMDDNLSEAYSAIYEMGKATPEAGTGKYYNEKKPTPQQLEVRKKINPPKTEAQKNATQKYNKIKELGNKGKHKEASELYKEEKKPLPKTKMYRKAGNLSRDALSKGLDSKEGSKAQDRSSKIVSTISTADEKKRFNNMKTKKSELYNDTTGKFRQEWETNKLVEKNNYREKFETWLEGIVEEGYDIERWSDEELVDTFIHENDLWKSKDSVMIALSESDKKGKGSGKKDACYKKVKASASVWPSAYASGRLVQCRKKGAANYGKSSKKEDFSDWRDDLGLVTEMSMATGAIQAAAKPITKAVTRLGIKVAGKTGGKVAQNLIKGAGNAAKDAAITGATAAGAKVVNKVVDKVKPKQKEAPTEVSPANPK